MNKRRAGVLCMLLGALLLAGALLLMMENRQEEAQAGEEASLVLAELQKELALDNGSLLLPAKPDAAESAEASIQPETREAEAPLPAPAQDAPKASASANTAPTPVPEATLRTAMPMISSSASAVPEPQATLRTAMPMISSSAAATRTPAPSAAPTALSGEMPTMKIDKQSYIGYIELPTLGISLPVISEWSYPRLRIAPCRYSGSAYDDSLVILAHNYARHFGNIQRLSIGDPVQFIDARGNIFRYVVAKHETLGRRDVKEMIDSGYDLTLFTCTYGGKYRITVRLNRVDGY